MKDNITFSEQLHEIRAEQQLTQKQAYTLLNVPRRTYENWEAGTNVPPAYVQKIVLAALQHDKSPQ